MREIKFRGLRTDGEGWVYGDLVRKYSKSYIVYEVKSNSFGRKRSVWVETEVDPDSIGQFTGRHYKNGKEIYERDVCKVRYYNHGSPDYIVNQFVSFEDGAFTLNSKNNENYKLDDLFRSKCPLHWGDAPNNVEFLGNVHENPELL